ncbi:hypothetical protein Lal_00036765 [Lupinus albus]|uniref:Putative E3 ubiquitin-protein ligase MARCH n=1 Tax=Lupinus albus TaxID=3870 RepID=A0A6A5NLL5_LUPAL|nr:putative E3 ubiquitin-protein ligase MARCH [Lupinus albus]KAF1888724.1 hypothetical protein Lal_00036765 [Lupinus albus]
MKFSHDMDVQINTPPEILEQCRICHDEDKDSDMEIPCSCCGTLKYAHRKCVQRWCNEKGDTTCEICLQEFSPGYNAPQPSLFHYGDSPINFGWGIQNDDFMGMFNANNHELLESELEYSSSPSPSTLKCFRIIAIIFIVLLVLHHALPIIFVLSEIFSGLQEYSWTMIMLVLLRAIEMVVPINLLVKAIIGIQRLQHQDYHSNMQSHEENDLDQSELSVIHIQ